MFGFHSSSAKQETVPTVQLEIFSSAITNFNSAIADKLHCHHPITVEKYLKVYYYTNNYTRIYPWTNEVLENKHT